MDLLKSKLKLCLGFVNKRHKVNSGVQQLVFSWLLPGVITTTLSLDTSSLASVLDWPSWVLSWLVYLCLITFSQAAEEVLTNCLLTICDWIITCSLPTLVPSLIILISSPVDFQHKKLKHSILERISFAQTITKSLKRNGFTTLMFTLQNNSKKE